MTDKKEEWKDLIARGVIDFKKLAENRKKELVRLKKERDERQVAFAKDLDELYDEVEQLKVQAEQNCKHCVWYKVKKE